MAKIFIVDSAGARVGSLATARERFDTANRAVFGSDLDTHDHTPQNQIAGINALVWTEVGEEILRAALYGASLDHAPGRFLDALGSLLDIKRRGQTFTRVTAIVRGQAGTVIPAGRFAKTVAGDQFVTERDVTIAEGGSEASFVAVNPGPVPAAAGTLTEIVSVLTGWDSIVNERDGIPGELEESDASFRAVLHDHTAASSIGAISSLRGALLAAGATDVRVIENATTGEVTKDGVTLPRNSIFIIAEGGTDDDIARATENHRGMGVGTVTATSGSKIVIQEANKITNGRMRFNGNLIEGFNLTAENLTGIASRLNTAATGVTGAPSYETGDGFLLSFSSWNPDAVGHAEAEGVRVRDGNNTIYYPDYAESEAPLPSFFQTSAIWDGTRIRSVWSDYVKSAASGSNDYAVKYMLTGTETTHSKTGDSISTHGNSVLLTLGSAIPAGATEIKVSFDNVRNRHDVRGDSNEFSVTTVTNGSTDAPTDIEVYGEPRDGGVAIWASAIGTVTKWEYQVFHNGQYGATQGGLPVWQTITGSGNALLPSPSSATGQLITSSVLVNGDQNARISLRAVNSTHGGTATASVIFTPSDRSPQILPASTSNLGLGSYADGQAIRLLFDTDLRPDYITSGFGAQWNIRKGATSYAVTEQRVIGRSVYLRLNTSLPARADFAVDDYLTISYTTGGSTGIVGFNGVNASTFTNNSNTVQNGTVGGIPGAPMPVLMYERDGSFTIDWDQNDATDAADRMEYQYSTDGGLTFTDWQTRDANSNSVGLTFPSGVYPNKARVRGSNPNSRSAEILGLLGATNSVNPFVRPVHQPLNIVVNINPGSTLTGDDLDVIRDAVIAQVNSYEIGETILDNDLEARIEILPRVSLRSISVKSGTVNVNGIAQKAFNKWTIQRSDIEINFISA